MQRLFVLSAILVLAGCNAGQQDAPVEPAEPAGQVESGSAGDEQRDEPDSSVAVATEQEGDRREPVETRAANADWQSPAFEGQTRAPQPAETERWQVETVAEGLDHPWAIEFLPDGSMLVTERPGDLRHVGSDGTVSDPISGVPDVHAQGQGGLLDVAVSPGFEQDRRIFFSYAEPAEDGSRTAVATARLREDNTALDEVEVIFRQQPSWQSRGHYGSRIVFAEDGTLFITLGDRMNGEIRVEAQDPSNHIGTVVRINTDGSVPEDNPFADGNEGAPEVWSWGHRNLQAADRHPDSGDLWTVEHGPRGGDELNRPQAGDNHGWPDVTYGVEYSGDRVGPGETERDDVVQPVYYWDPVLAPSGMDFYEGDRFEAWQGDLFVGGLGTQRVSRLVIEANRVTAEEWLPIGERVRDVKEGPDGAIYLVTDENNGKILRIVPEESDS